MSRIALPLNCTAEVMQELVHLSKSRTGEARLIERAKIVLRCLAGERNDEKGQSTHFFTQPRPYFPKLP